MRDGRVEESQAAYCFEEALEQAADLSFGILIFVGPDQSKDEMASCKELLIKSLRWLRGYIGLVLPEIKIVEDDCTLQEDEFQIQLNDVRLPVLRRPLQDEIAAPAFILIDELTKRGIKSRLIVDPFAGFNWHIVSEADSIEKYRKAYS